jgi:hypothetical protein
LRALLEAEDALRWSAGFLVRTAACLRWLVGIAAGPNPVVDISLVILGLGKRSKASLHDFAGGQFSIMSERTEVAARTVKSTSSRL